MLQQKKAVIFDLDGTLVDSMWMWRDIDIEFLGKNGIALPEDLQEKIEGMSFTETAEYFKKEFGLAQSVSEMKEIWNEMAREKYLHEVPLKEGAYEFLEYLLENGYKMGIASSNSMELISAVGSTYHFDRYFSCIVTSCSVNKGKPFPDVYLEAARQLGVEPADCLVFEDIVKGIQAGKNAGMEVCAIYDDYSKDQTEEKRQAADYYINDYRDVLSALAEGSKERE
ncbi:MAG: HAD family phosphatase [Roseburia sp.]|uniref:HAD family hydrolase n=1 Tax=Roseburia sp. 831b TaxID=1261635 RepID=UPI000951C0C8|nr:HAD family phosphatase [Roseburia sp. 831b]MCI5918329.1 HAD family phosphatase [Roseburia sp.]MDD6215678.1 HAD family phosphatase [Roseburia sp.]MDY5881779.1 HAD family phosphatase [Roseburia sp.]WVK73988.1 HAD family phosphatase [Roseburia sp. 831b]